MVTGARAPRRRAARARWSSSNSMLRGSNRPGLESGVIRVTRAIYLGPKRGTGGALATSMTAGGGSARRRNDGARVPASGAVYGLRHLRKRSRGRWCSPRVQVGLEGRAGVLATTAGGGAWTETGGACGEGGCGRSPSFGSPRINAGSPCQDVEGVRKAGEPSAASNHGGGEPHHRRPRVEFRPLHRPESRMKSSGSLLAARRSCRRPWPGLGCGGATGPRWSRGAKRWSKATVMLGRRWRLRGLGLGFRGGVGTAICRAAGYLGVMA
jgi:hypothetical protein